MIGHISRFKKRFIDEQFLDSLVLLEIIQHDYSLHIFLYVYKQYFKKLCFEIILLIRHIRCFKKRLIDKQFLVSLVLQETLARFIT